MNALLYYVQILLQGLGFVSLIMGTLNNNLDRVDSTGAARNHHRSFRTSSHRVYIFIPN
jgi:hypothetical protein